MDIVIGDRQNSSRAYSYATNPTNYPAENPVSGFASFNRSVAIACVTTADFNAAGSAPAPSCVGVTNYARVTVTVTHSAIGSVTGSDAGDELLICCFPLREITLPLVPSHQGRGDKSRYLIKGGQNRIPSPLAGEAQILPSPLVGEGKGEG